MIKEFKVNKGAHFCLYWLLDRYTELVGQYMYEASVTVYMLHLVRCTILADNSHEYIYVRYISLFTDLNHVN